MTSIVRSHKPEYGSAHESGLLEGWQCPKVLGANNPLQVVLYRAPLGCVVGVKPFAITDLADVDAPGNPDFRDVIRLDDSGRRVKRHGWTSLSIVQPRFRPESYARSSVNSDAKYSQSVDNRFSSASIRMAA